MTFATSSLSDLCTLVTDGTHDTPKTVPEGIPLIKGKDISKGYIDFSTCDFVSDEDHQKIVKRSKAERGDTLFANIGNSLGDVAFVDTDTAFSIKNVALFKPDPTTTDPRYLFYLLKSPIVQRPLLAQKAGAAQPFLGLGALRCFQVFHHSKLETQQRIAAILGAYDDLIEVNRRRVAVLEEMARGLFKEWFVRFRFPGHENVPIVDTPDGPLPEGWVWERLSSFGEIVTGKTPSKKRPEHFGEDIPFVKIPDLHGSIFLHETGEHLSFEGAASQRTKTIPENTVVVSCIGTIGLVAITTRGCQTNQQINAVIPDLSQQLEYLYFCLKQAKAKLINLGSNGATMGNVNKQKFSNLLLPLPPEELVGAFAQCSRPLLKLAGNLERANRSLAASRDLLLPRLISGQLSVEAAERELEDAA